jgi:hypothetical protein
MFWDSAREGRDRRERVGEELGSLIIVLLDLAFGWACAVQYVSILQQMAIKSSGKVESNVSSVIAHPAYLIANLSNERVLYHVRRRATRRWG